MKKSVVLDKEISGSISGSVPPRWGKITGNYEDQQDIINYIDSNDNNLNSLIDAEATKRVANINNLSENLNNEIDIRESQYELLNNKLNAESLIREESDKEIAAMTTGFKELVAKEERERKSEDYRLNSLISDEVVERKQSINSLSTNVDIIKETNGLDILKKLKQDKGLISGAEYTHLGTSALKDVEYFNSQITSEVNERKSEDTKLTNKLNQEINLRSEGDSLLTTNLNNEVNTRQGQFNSLSTGLETEKNERQSADSSLQSSLVSLTLTNAQEHQELNNKIENEKESREVADSLLQAQISGIKVHSSFIDIVNTYQDLLDYDKSKLIEGDVIKVLKDENRNYCSSNFKWNGTSWVLIGTEGPYYTQDESGNLFVSKNLKINGHELSNDFNLNYIDVGALSKDTIIGKADIILRNNGVEAGRFNANQTNNAIIDFQTAYKLSQLQDDDTHKVVSNAQISTWNNKQNALVSGSSIKTLNGESLLGSGNISLASMVDDIKVNGTSVVTDRVANITVPKYLNDLVNRDNMYATTYWVNSQGYLTQHQSLSEYAKSSWVSSNFLTQASLNNYATNSSVDSKLTNYAKKTDLTSKQDVISDLETIRTGASKGNTAVQPAAISDMATKTWVGEQGYLTDASLSSYRTSAEQDVIDATKQDKLELGDYLYFDSEGKLDSYVIDNYLLLENKPLINSTLLVGDLSLDDLNIQEKLTAGPGITIYREDNLLKIKSEGGSGSPVWGNITGSISNQTDLQLALSNKQQVLSAGNNISISGNVIGTTANRVSVSNTGTSTDEVNYITIDGVEKKLAGGGSGTSTVVQINGESIMSGNIANINTNSAYNSSTNKIATMSDLNLTDTATGKQYKLIVTNGVLGIQEV